MRKWQARSLAVVVGLIWLFGLMAVEGILLMSGAHATDTGQRQVLAVVAVVGLGGVALGAWVVSVVWRSGQGRG